MLQPQRVDLNALLTSLDKVLPGLMGERIVVSVDMAPDLPAIRADPSAIEQVIMNLAMNARDAMPDGGRLTLETSAIELDEAYVGRHSEVIAGSYVRLAITDTGHGMDIATCERVFEPFFTTKEQGKGTGLGLATVYGLVKQSGGYIWVYSELGHGTVFKVYLPVAEAATSTRPPAPGSHRYGGSETVLVVEDEDAVRLLGCQILRRYGYSVLEARNPLDALRVAERHQEAIHLMVTDLVMPHMSGQDLADRLRQARPAMRVLLMSGFTEPTIAGRDATAGIAFLQKPFTPAALARKVRAVLDGSTSRLS